MPVEIEYVDALTVVEELVVYHFKSVPVATRLAIVAGEQTVCATAVGADGIVVTVKIATFESTDPFIFVNTALYL